MGIDGVVVKSSKSEVVTLKSPNSKIISPNYFNGIEEQINELVKQKIYDIGIKIDPGKSETYPYCNLVLNFINKLRNEGVKASVISSNDIVRDFFEICNGGVDCYLTEGHFKEKNFKY